LPTHPTIKAFAVSKLRFLSFHGMEEVVGSIPTRSTKFSTPIIQTPKNTPIYTQLPALNGTHPGKTKAACPVTAEGG